MMSKTEGAPPGDPSGFFLDRASFLATLRRQSTDSNGPGAFWDFDSRAHAQDSQLPMPGHGGSEIRAVPFDGLSSLDREARWANVRRLSALFHKLIGEISPGADLPKDSYYELYNTAVSLVRAVDILDPDRGQAGRRPSEFFGGSGGSFSAGISVAGSAPTTASADLDWLSRRSMDLFPRASFTLPLDPPMIPIPPPPAAPAPASAALTSAATAPAASGLTGGATQAPQPQQQQPQPLPQPQPQPQPQQQLQQQQPTPPQASVGASYSTMPPQSPGRMQPNFFGNGPFVMGSGGPYVMQGFLPSFSARSPPTAPPPAPSGTPYYAQRTFIQQPHPTMQVPQQGQPGAQFQPAAAAAAAAAAAVKPVRQVMPPVIRSISQPQQQTHEIIFTPDETKVKKRGNTSARRNLRCNMCNATETPEWRRGPDGEHTLCNACGLHYAKVLKRERLSKSKRRKHSIESILNKDQKKESPPPAAAPSAAAAPSDAKKDGDSSDDARRSSE